MNLTIIAAAVAGALGFTLAWQLQAGNIAKMEIDHANTRLAAAAAARQTIERTTHQVITAQNNAASRVFVLRRDADASRNSLVGLRESTDHAMRAAAADLDACNSNTATTNQLFNQCGAELQTLGERADGHVSDIKTLSDAWAK